MHFSPLLICMCPNATFVFILKKQNKKKHKGTAELWRQRQDLHHLLPAVPSDEAGEAPVSRGRNSDPAVDLHQILPGEAGAQHNTSQTTGLGLHTLGCGSLTLMLQRCPGTKDIMITWHTVLKCICHLKLYFNLLNYYCTRWLSAPLIRTHSMFLHIVQLIFFIVNHRGVKNIHVVSRATFPFLDSSLLISTSCFRKKWDQ